MPRGNPQTAPKRVRPTGDRQTGEIRKTRGRKLGVKKRKQKSKKNQRQPSDPIAGAIRKKDVKALCTVFFQINLALKQQEIVRAIAFREHHRIVINSYTRYGKTLCVALGVLLYIVLNTNKRVLLIAPTYTQAAILRNYMSEYMIRCPLFKQLIITQTDDISRLKKEWSKNRLTFTNGCEIQILSADGSAERLMGHGGDLIILDESCLINPETYRLRVSRMLGDNPDSIEVQIGNPFDRLNQFYEAWINPSYHKIHIPYTVGISEERVTEAFIEEQRLKFKTDPNGFKVLYDAVFPEDTEDTLIRYEWIQEAMKPATFGEGELVFGLDVAEFGRDVTVLHKIGVSNGHYYLLNTWSWVKQDTITTANKVADILGKDMDSPVFVDATGVGTGTASRLGELGYNAYGVKWGMRADLEPERFVNLKARQYWTLRVLFEEGRIHIGDAEHTLIRELNSLQYEKTSGFKIKIIDPEDKSPDFSDALCLGCGSLVKEMVLDTIRV